MRFLVDTVDILEFSDFARCHFCHIFAFWEDRYYMARDGHDHCKKAEGALMFTPPGCDTQPEGAIPQHG